jgi:hypothetical protein
MFQANSNDTRDSPGYDESVHESLPDEEAETGRARKRQKRHLVPEDISSTRDIIRRTHILPQYVDQLIAALAVVQMLCGGLDQKGPIWEMIEHAMDFNFSATVLHRKWLAIKKEKGESVDLLQDALREPFLAAYESGELPRIDFQDLTATDWPAFVRWALPYLRTLPVTDRQQRSVRGRPAQRQSPIIEFPASRSNLNAQYQIISPDTPHEPDLNRYFEVTIDKGRSAIALSLAHGHSVPITGGLDSTDSSSIDLIKSLCRAVSVTPEHVYDAEAAAARLGLFPDHLVRQAIDELLEAGILGTERKGRQLPGRNFYLSKNVLKQLERWPGDDETYLRRVAAARDKILASLVESDELTLSFHTDDFDVVVLTNMVAHGQLAISSILPPRNNDLHAPFPRLSIWGVDEPATLYNTHAVRKDRLRFPITYTKTPAFSPTHNLKTDIPIPLSLALLDEHRPRLPLWTDINGSLIPDLWDRVLRSLLHLVVFRPGITAVGMEKAHAGLLWRWEIEMALGWMEEVGLAISFGPGKEEEGVWRGGWRAGGEWWVAFAGDVAIWGGGVKEVRGKGKGRAKEVA